MLIKGEDADNIVLGDTFTKDGFDRDAEGKKRTFDYMLANPPFGVEWKQQQKYIEHEAETRWATAAASARALPRINDGALLFLQHMLAKMRAPKDGGSRIGIVFNGSPLFTGDAGSGESDIRRWIIENDWLEAVVALPDQLFYNTGISTYSGCSPTAKSPPQGQGPAHRRPALLGARWKKASATSATSHRRPRRPPERPGPHRRHHPIFGNFTDGETRRLQRRGPDHSAARRPQSGWSARSSTTPTSASQDHRRAPAATELPGDRRAHRAAGDRKRLRQPRHQRQEEREGVRLEEIEAGKQRQEIRRSCPLRRSHTAKDAVQGPQSLPDRPARIDRAAGVRLSAPELKAVLAALGERDDTAEICRDRNGAPSPTPTCATPRACRSRKASTSTSSARCCPHVPDAWIDTSKTKVGYEIPLNRHFYRYEPPRPLEVIEADIKFIAFLFYVSISRWFRSTGEGEMYGAGGQKRVPPEFCENARMPLPPMGDQRAIAEFLDCETAKLDTLVVKKRTLIERLKERRTALISRAVTRGLPPGAARAAGLDPHLKLKPSGINWLGDVPEHWDTRRLRHISNTITVGVVVNPSSYVSDEGVPFLLGGDVREFSIDTSQSNRCSPESSEGPLRKSRLSSGDLVVVRVGYPGVAAVVQPALDGANCASMMIVRGHPRFCSQWLAYLFNSQAGRDQIEIVQYGAAQKQFNISHAVDFAFPFPPVEEQSAIAAFLDRETARIGSMVAKVETAIARLQEYRTALITAAVTGKVDVRPSLEAHPT
jgi:restriction endonuclease S subunit